ncbi:MAG: hypothetical protein HOY71_41510, partial [Nonomuraea sp.]|nr:hypothetical protein [Nonomuraea sp.]
MLFGWEDLRARLDALLGERRLITLTGPAGIGKSALARAVLSAQPRARMVDVTRGLPTDDPGGLLVLDTCDHRLDDCADLVDDLLSRPGDRRIVLTSREALGTIGEHVLTVPPLPAAAAEALFRHHAAGLSAPPLEALEGFPLAIKIAAEHLLDGAALERMVKDGSFYDLPSGPGHPARHASLRTAAAWSRASCRPLDLHA